MPDLAASRLDTLLFALALLVATPTIAVQPPADAAKERSALALVEPSFMAAEPSVAIPGRDDLAQTRAGRDLRRFLARHPGAWDARWDLRGDRPHLIQGTGVPLLPGRGNRLTRGELGLPAEGPLQLADVEARLRAFLAGLPELFRVPPGELVLDPASSFNVSPDEQIWLIELRQVHRGVPVEGASVFFRINQGNIVQLGAERIADVHIGVEPEIGPEAAFEAALRAAGIEISEVAERPAPAALKIYPVAPPGEGAAERYQGPPGLGYRHLLVWEVSFRRAGDPATYQAVVDAATAEVLQLVDANSHARVTGGILPKSPLAPAEIRGLPLVLVDTASGPRTTDLDGNYDYPGGIAASRLEGALISVRDFCGPRLLEDGTTGDLAFGTNDDADCVNPGVGGSGNTNASRTAYYHLTRAHSKALSYLPSNPWLNSLLTVNVNINSTCNAFWNGSTLNFYRSGGGCSNTGEIASILVHEWGHGMDANTGGAAAGDLASQEAHGDTFAFLETRDACIGPDLLLTAGPCPNCTANCLRDLAAFAAGGPSTLARPSTIADDGGINCDRFGCPLFFGRGPMGYQGYCESHIASTANWDLAQRLVARWGNETGWQRMEAIWYRSLSSLGSAYRVVSGGTCNPAAQVDGCGASNWYTVYLAVDDDDGNLANGTPNGCRIWDAFNQHGIACGSRPACTSGGPVLTGTLAAGEYVFHDEDVIVDDLTVTGPSTFVVRVHGGSLHVNNLTGAGAPGGPGQPGGGGLNVVLETLPSRYGNTAGPWPITIGQGGIRVGGGRGGDGADGTHAFDSGCPNCQVTDANGGQIGGGGGRGGGITLRASGDLLIHGGLDASGGDGGDGGFGGSAELPGTSPKQGGPGGQGGAGGSVVLAHTASAPADARIEIVLDHNSNGGAFTGGGAGGRGGDGGSWGDGGSTPERGANGGLGGSGGPITVTGRNLFQLGWNLLGQAIGANLVSHGGTGGNGGDGGEGAEASLWFCPFACHNICHPTGGTQGAAGGLGGSGGPGGPITIAVTDEYASSWSGVSTNGGHGGRAGFSGSSGFDTNLCGPSDCPGGYFAFAGVPGSPSGSGGTAADLRLTADTLGLGPAASLSSQGGDGATAPPGGLPGSFCCENAPIFEGQGSQGGQGGSGGNGGDIVLAFQTLNVALGNDPYFPCGGDGANGGDGSWGQPAGIGGLAGLPGGSGSLFHNDALQPLSCTASGGTPGNTGGDGPSCGGA